MGCNFYAPAVHVSNAINMSARVVRLLRLESYVALLIPLDYLLRASVFGDRSVRQRDAVGERNET